MSMNRSATIPFDVAVSFSAGEERSSETEISEKM